VTLVPAILKRFGFTNIIPVPEQDIPDGNFPTVYRPIPRKRLHSAWLLKKPWQRMPSWSWPLIRMLTGLASRFATVKGTSGCSMVTRQAPS
jgi:hypothetical protein